MKLNDSSGEKQTLSSCGYAWFNWKATVVLFRNLAFLTNMSSISITVFSVELRSCLRNVLTLVLTIALLKRGLTLDSTVTPFCHPLSSFTIHNKFTLTISTLFITPRSLLAVMLDMCQRQHFQSDWTMWVILSSEIYPVVDRRAKKHEQSNTECGERRTSALSRAHDHFNPGGKTDELVQKNELKRLWINAFALWVFVALFYAILRLFYTGWETALMLAKLGLIAVESARSRFRISRHARFPGLDFSFRHARLPVGNGNRAKMDI